MKLRKIETSFDNIGWTVGNHCNAVCGHCYSWKVRKDSREFLTHSDVDTVISQLQRLGVKTVNLGGNEPIYTHGPDLSQTILPYIIRRLHEEQIPVGLTTNGMSYSRLKTHHPEELMMINDIDFSLDSPYREAHDLNRGRPLYNLVTRSVASARELGIDCSVITCGMHGNFTKDDLSAFLALTQILECEFRINTLKPIEPSLVDQMPDAKQFFDGFSFLMNNSECITLGESCLTAFTETGTSGCPCGTTSFRINAKTVDGQIPLNPCVYMHDFRTGDLLTEDINEIVAGEEFRQFAERRAHGPSECAGCELLDSCRGGCAARTYLTTGSLDNKDPYCPAEHLESEGGRRPDLPLRPEIGVHEGIRVHDNYLCTWIGEVVPEFSDPRFRTLEDFAVPVDTDGVPLSGCRQVGEDEPEALSSLESVPPVKVTIGRGE